METRIIMKDLKGRCFVSLDIMSSYYNLWGRVNNGGAKDIEEVYGKEVIFEVQILKKKKSGEIWETVSQIQVNLSMFRKNRGILGR